MRRSNIRLKMLFLIFITLIPLTVLRISEIKNNFKSSIEAEMIASRDFAEAINTTFINFLERTWANQYAIGTAIVASREWDNEEIESYLNTIAQNDKTFVRTSWTTPDGLVIAGSDPKLIGKSMRDRDFIKDIINGQEKLIATLRPSVVDGELVLPIARAIKSEGILQGIVVSIIKLDSLEDILPQNRLKSGSIFGLIDKNANLIYRNYSEHIPFEKRQVREDSPSRRALKGEIVKTYARNSGFDGSQRMGIDYPIKEIGWSCFVTTSVKELLANERQLLYRNIIGFILIYIISFIIAFGFASRIIRSINKLKVVAREIINGNLEVRTHIGRKDELSDVGVAFDKMIESLNVKVKEVEEYNNLRSQFFSTISHELKTPLNIILGCTQLLEKLDNKNHETFRRLFDKYIKMQKQNSYRLLRLINNLIDMNKAEVNHITINPSNNDIIRIVEDITMSIVEYTSLKNIEVIFDTEVEEKIIAFDADMMERIILNLLSNAIKFTEAGGLIEVNIYDRDEDILISVKDSGIGIPEDKLQVIFERFTQVNNSLRRKSEGSGIGLSLVKSLVELHGGSISVSSILGKGSQFIVSLPNKTISDDKDIATEKNIHNVERIHVEFSDIYM